MNGGKTVCKCMGIEGDKGGYIDMGICMLRISTMKNSGDAMQDFM